MNHATLCAMVIAINLVFAPSSSSQDYLSPERRAEVEQLKQDVATTPSDNANARVRARLAWGWVNAYAMQGKFIPVNATTYMNAVMNAPESASLSRARARMVDDLVREFTVYDESPASLGTLEIPTPGPFPIESWQTIQIRYTVGDMPLESGAQIMINRHFLSDAGRWQVRDPSGDNYITIASSNSSAQFTATTAPWRGMHGGFRGAAQQLAFQLEGTSLTKGDTFTVTYGDTSAGSRGYQVQTYSNDSVPVPIHIKFSPDDIFFSFPIPTYEVIGAEVASFVGFAPSVVEPGEKFNLSIRANDRYRNRAQGKIPRTTVVLNGENILTLPEGENGLQTMADLSIDKPGTYRYSFESADGTVTGMSNPIWVQENPEQRIYWGETHGHSGFAEGLGSAEGYFVFGRDDARLDFVTLSEHDIWMDDFEWATLNRLCKEYTVEGEFIALPGYEWTSPRGRGGHHNVFYNGFNFDRVPVQDAHYLSDLYFQLREKYDVDDVLIIPHAHQAGDWRKSDVYMERLVEIMSMHGTFEWFGKKYLEHGNQVGFISASDDHMGHPGYSSGSKRVRQQGGLAAVFSSTLTRNELFGAMRDRATYATSGDKIILDATVNGHAMGTRQEYTDTRAVKGLVKGTAPIVGVDLIKNGEVIDTRDYVKTGLQSHSFIQVGFESESDVFSGRDNPRGYRPWIGWIEVKNATIKGVTAPGFYNARGEWARLDAESPNRVMISTATRGRLNNMILELDGVSEKTSIRVVLEEGVEEGTAPVVIRPFAKIPGADLTLLFADMEENKMSHEFRVGRHTDRLSLTAVNPTVSMDRKFSFDDKTEPGNGDYYYVRARQLNGGLAWSSPFWIGGEAPS